MPTLYFLYRSKKQIAPLTLRLMHKTKGKPIDIFVNSTYSIDRKYWDANKKVVKGTDATAKNHKVKLLDFEHHILNRLGVDFSLGITISKEWLSNEIENYFGRNQNDENLSFIEYYENYIQKYASIPLPSTGKPLAKSSIKTYKSAFSLIKEFNDGVYSLTFEKITTDFYEDYLNFLYDSEYSTNYIGAQIKTLKTIMNVSFEEGLHTNRDYSKRAFKKPTEEVFNIYLNENELEALYKVDLSLFENKRLTNGLTLSSKKLEIARDLFLISANTGLRVSDFTRITKENIITLEGKSYLKLNTFKTDTNLTIPVNSMVQSILDKYKKNQIPTLPHQHINYALKELCKLALIDEPITKEITKGRLKVSKKLKKYEMVTNHTARRSFCTNAYKSGMPTIDIMSISGHKSERIFLNYIKVTEDERAIKISSHKFFNTSALKKA